MLLFTGMAFAEVSIKAEVDKVSLSTDDFLTYKLTVSSSERNVPAPQLPDFKAFSAVSQMQSSNISFGRKDIATVIVYTYILVPLQAGDFSIGPGTIKIENTAYSTEEFKIKVTQGKARSEPEAEPGPSEPKKIKIKSDASRITL